MFITSCFFIFYFCSLRTKTNLLFFVSGLTKGKPETNLFSPLLLVGEKKEEKKRRVGKKKEKRRTKIKENLDKL